MRVPTLLVWGHFIFKWYDKCKNGRSGDIAKQVRRRERIHAFRKYAPHDREIQKFSNLRRDVTLCARMYNVGNAFVYRWMYLILMVRQASAPFKGSWIFAKQKF